MKYIDTYRGIHIIPLESCVSKVHLNISRATNVKIKFSNGSYTGNMSKNGWITDKEIKLWCIKASINE